MRNRILLSWSNSKLSVEQKNLLQSKWHRVLWWAHQKHIRGNIFHVIGYFSCRQRKTAKRAGEASRMARLSCRCCGLTHFVDTPSVQGLWGSHFSSVKPWQETALISLVEMQREREAGSQVHTQVCVRHTIKIAVSQPRRSTSPGKKESLRLCSMSSQKQNHQSRNT